MGNIGEVKRLVDKGAEVNAQDDCDRAPLYRAASNGHKDVAAFLCQRGRCQ
ncbi:MAG: hypothetical protein GTO12_21170 [Proteobacteria bacterium]|nr:hypothetical protein [Pseudomonadota bacterium]